MKEQTRTMDGRKLKPARDLGNPDWATRIFPIAKLHTKGQQHSTHSAMSDDPSRELEGLEGKAQAQNGGFVGDRSSYEPTLSP